MFRQKIRLNLFESVWICLNLFGYASLDMCVVVWKSLRTSRRPMTWSYGWGGKADSQRHAGSPKTTLWGAQRKRWKSEPWRSRGHGEVGPKLQGSLLAYYIMITTSCRISRRFASPLRDIVPCFSDSSVTREKKCCFMPLQFFETTSHQTWSLRWGESCAKKDRCKRRCRKKCLGLHCFSKKNGPPKAVPKSGGLCWFYWISWR